MELLVLLIQYLVLPFVPFAVAILIIWGLTRRIRAWKVRAVWICTLGLVGTILLIYGPTWTYLLLNVAEYCAKTGKIIDAETGAGMPGVFVIAAGEVTESAVHTGIRQEYRLIVRTDADGKYIIPPTWRYAVSPSYFWWNWWIASSRHEWAITPVVPGYIEPQDERHLIRPDGEAGVRVFLDKSNPPHSWHGFEVEVQPLILRKYELSTAQAVVYYRPDLVSHELSRALFDYLLPKICSATADSKTAMGVTGGLVDFLGSTQSPKSDREELAYQKFMRELKGLEPTGFQPLNGGPVFRNSKDYPYFQTVNVCEALQNGVAP